MHPSRDSSLGFSPVGVSMNQASLHRRSTTGGQGEVCTDATGWSFPIPQVALGRTDAQANRSEGGFDHAGVGLMRHRVAPPTQFDGRMPDEPIEPELEGNDFVHYFTNLLVNDQESHDLPPPSHTSNDDVPRASKGSQKRTKNFRDDEDRLLVSAWLNIGMDPIQGSDQPLGAYWRRIHQYFHANKTFDSDRTQGPLMNRWGVIQHDVNLFCGCLSKIETRNQSGCSVDDKVSLFVTNETMSCMFICDILVNAYFFCVCYLHIASACAMFKAEDIKNTNFAYMHCWKILKDMPKWIAWKNHRAATKIASNKKQKTVSNSSPASARMLKIQKML
ncbi:uncharacterized protein LOC102708776 isoform X1 [Oryza brachyantha]|uniref:uncharacterized protein LOC102708776 isoform X1 n=1 Tax=Oryza brachyantha TaxID=4533 RepID=UPI001ADB49EB|nr:uncharacterized protein LOC102708776 isoform X1 [Oryza brachyantha]